MDLNDLRIDPEFEEKIPPLTEDEFLLLEQPRTFRISMRPLPGSVITSLAGEI